MGLIVLLPLLAGVLFTAKRWHTAQQDCLNHHPSSAFYPCGHMTEEVAALRLLDEEIAD